MDPTFGHWTLYQRVYVQRGRKTKGRERWRSRGRDVPSSSDVLAHDCSILVDNLFLFLALDCGAIDTVSNVIRDWHGFDIHFWTLETHVAGASLGGRPVLYAWVGAGTVMSAGTLFVVPVGFSATRILSSACTPGGSTAHWDM
jgi:hypothetical protein